MLWGIFAAMVAVALAVVVIPLLRSRQQVETGDEHQDLAVYRDQLDELKQAEEQGLLSEREAKEARLEIERRMLKAAARAEAPSSARPIGRWVALVVVLVIPALSLGLYHDLGSPGLPDVPFASRTDMNGMPGTQHQAIERLVEKLAKRMESRPDDVDGWMLLGRSYASLGRYADAVDAFQNAVLARPEDSDLYLALGESMVYAAGGKVIDDARAIFKTALSLEPGSIGARYYLALARFQDGDYQAAYDSWARLIRESPADAPWLPDLSARLKEAADKLGVEVPKIEAGAAQKDAGAPPAPAEMSEAERAAFVESMVTRLAERLKKSPNDLDGWIRLGRAYAVMRRYDDAANAYRKAVTLAPEAIDYRLALADMIIKAAGQPTEIPAEARSLYEDVLKDAPDNQIALWVVGHVRAMAGNVEGAVALWRRLLAQLKPDSEQYKTVRAQIDSVSLDGAGKGE